MRVYIAGRRGAGKTTAALIIERRFGARVVKITAPLYDIARLYFGMAAKDRLLLQRLGDAFRAVDRAWLAKHAARSAERWSDPVVIEGVRTVEEAVWLNSQGWVGILIVAPATARLARRAGEPVEADDHHTEAGVDLLPVALRIENAGTIEAFEEAVVAAVAPLCGRRAAPCAKRPGIAPVLS